MISAFQVGGSNSTLFLHTLSFLQAAGFYAFKDNKALSSSNSINSSSNSISNSFNSSHQRSLSTSKAFCWILNALKNRGLNTESCFLKHKKAK